jgi:hypothetical protein
MIVFRDNEYQDSQAVGSVVGALILWQALVAADNEARPQQLAFTLACSSESRASRVAGFLRRHRACAVTRVSRVEARHPEDWHVQGTTRHEVQSLANLEALFTWLRGAANSHQVKLVSLAM